MFQRLSIQWITLLLSKLHFHLSFQSWLVSFIQYVPLIAVKLLISLTLILHLDSCALVYPKVLCLVQLSVFSLINDRPVVLPPHCCFVRSVEELCPLRWWYIHFSHREWLSSSLLIFTILTSSCQHLDEKQWQYIYSLSPGQCHSSTSGTLLEGFKDRAG